MADDETLRFYTDNAATYARHRTSPSGKRLDSFLESLPAGARVLELGCGNGMDAAHMLERGFDIDATDGTPELIVDARKRVGGRARVLRFEHLEAVAEYDGVWACASLPHILQRIHRALRPGGVFVASYKGGNGEGRDAMGRYYNYPSTDALEAAYHAAGWSDLRLETTMGSGFDALPTQWLWMTARR